MSTPSAWTKKINKARLQRSGRRSRSYKGSFGQPPLKDDSLERTVALGTELPAEAHDAILRVIRSNADVFAWSSEDIPGVAWATIEHRLALRSEAQPKKQKLRCMSAERLEAAKK